MTAVVDGATRSTPGPPVSISPVMYSKVCRSNRSAARRFTTCTKEKFSVHSLSIHCLLFNLLCYRLKVFLFWPDLTTSTQTQAASPPPWPPTNTWSVDDCTSLEMRRDTLHPPWPPTNAWSVDDCTSLEMRRDTLTQTHRENAIIEKSTTLIY